MELQIFQHNNMALAELVGQDACIRGMEGVQGLMAHVDEEELLSGLIIKRAQIDEGSFDLRSGIGSLLLQLLTERDIRLAVVGKLGALEGLALSAYLRSKQADKQARFCKSREEALDFLTKS